MTQRKKILYLGLALNLIFYIGVSLALFFYSINDKKASIKNQLQQLIQFEEILLREKHQTALQLLTDYLSHKTDPKNFHQLALSESIVAITKYENGERTHIIDPQRDEPLPTTLFSATKPLTVFYKHKKQTYFSFLFPKGYNETLTTSYMVTIKHTPMILPTNLTSLKSDISVIERIPDGSNVVLYSSLPKPHQAQLKLQITIPPDEPINLSTEPQNISRKSLDMNLSNEQYILFPVFLINQAEIAQIIVYSFKIKDFSIVDTYSALIFVILLLCVSCGITIMSYIWSHERPS